MTDPGIPPQNHVQREEDRLAIIELRARLARMEVELLDAHKLTVDEITTKQGAFGFFDRHGMMGLLFGVFVQTAGIIWWASTLTNQVHEIQRTTEAQQALQTTMAKTLQENADRLTRVQTVQENVVKILDATIVRVPASEAYRGHATDPFGGQQRGPEPPTKSTY